MVIPFIPVLFWMAPLLWAELLSAAEVRPVGVVQSVDPATKKIVLRSDAGPAMDVVISDETAYVKVKPGEKDLANAQPLTVSDLSPGDRVIVQGSPAKRVIVMAKVDVATKHAADRAQWEANGIVGTVGSIDPSTRKLVVNVRSGMPPVAKPVDVALGADGTVRRYAPDSIRFADAQLSALDQVKAGDQVRVRGKKSGDGASMTAEEIVAGTFRNIAATVESVDIAAGTIRVKDLDAKKSVLVKLSPDSSARRMPEMMARMMSMMLNGEMPQRPAGSAAPGIASPNGPPGGGPRPGGGVGGGRIGGGSAQMFERMPALKLDELKPGDALIIVSTEGVKTGEVTAIGLVAGVEPILTAPSKNRQMMLGNWNFDSGAGMGMGLAQ